jgi:hypothetical protein
MCVAISKMNQEGTKPVVVYYYCQHCKGGSQGSNAITIVAGNKRKVPSGICSYARYCLLQQYTTQQTSICRSVPNNKSRFTKIQALINIRPHV